MKSTSIKLFLAFMIVLSSGCKIQKLFKLGKGANVAVKKQEFNAEGIYILIKYFNSLETFPIDTETVEKATGLPFSKVFSPNSTGIYVGEGFSMLLGLRAENKKVIITKVNISAEKGKIPVPEMPPGKKFRESVDNYLPYYRVSGPIAKGIYRSLYYMDMEEQKKVGGGLVSPPKWKYHIDDKRGSYISDSEKQEEKEVVMGLLNAIKENRFEAFYEDFQKKYPRRRYDGHKFSAHSLTVMYFNNNKDGKYFGEHLEEEGLSEYVGLHFYRTIYFEGYYPRPYLFDFFGIDQLDGLQAPKTAPYAVLKNRDGVPHPPAIEEGLEASLPSIENAGVGGGGGLLYYNDLIYSSEGWLLTMTGLYPHDGKKVERFLKKNILQIRSFEVLFSRKTR